MVAAIGLPDMGVPSLRRAFQSADTPNLRIRGKLGAGLAAWVFELGVGFTPFSIRRREDSRVTRKFANWSDIMSTKRGYDLMKTVGLLVLAAGIGMASVNLAEAGQFNQRQHFDAASE